MANQYQNFSNPTITPDQPMGWQLANQQTAGAINNIGTYFSKQQDTVNQMQSGLGTALLNAKLNRLLYPQFGNPQADPVIDKMISSNPYTRQILSRMQSSLGTSGQGANSSGASGSNGMGMMMPMAGGGLAYTVPNMGGSPGGGGNGSNGGSLSPINPMAGNGPVVTSGTQTLKTPVGDISQTTANPAGEATVQGAKSFSGAMGTEMAGAQAGTAKDNQQLAMITNALKPLAKSYDNVYNSKVAGIMPAAGDIYGSTIVKNADMIPLFAQSSVVPPDTQKEAGQFLANKNELVTKLQPLLSQQFGKDGSSRIMETLINMSQNEIGDLNTPRAQFHGQITGTISSLYRIAKAAQAYKQDLETSGQPVPDTQTAAKEIINRMNLQKQTPQEQKELQGLINDTLGIKSTAPGTGSVGSQNPRMQAQPKSKQQPQAGTQTQPQTNKLPFSRQEILDELNRRKNLRDVMSNISQ